MIPSPFLLALCLFPSFAFSQDPVRPPELGKLHYSRDLDATLSQLDGAKEDGKPIFVVFQEIPGWSVCVDFGQQVLSHPLLVEAIEAEFHPVVIHNNKKGRDAEILKRYKEPAWNNPIVRFVDAKGKDLIARQGGIYSVPALAERMVQALKAAKRPVPQYLQLLTLDERSSALRKVSFAMFWYGEGEAALGALPGVVRTQAGWLEKNEVVEVYYDPDRTSLEKLIEQAKGIRKFSKAWIDSEIDLLAAKKLIEDKAVQTAGQIRRAKDSDQLYYLRRSLIWWLPLTNQQAIRANSLLARKEDATDVLSAAQNKLLTTIKARFPKKGQGLVLLQDLRPCRDPVQFVSYELALLEVLEKSQRDR